LNQLLSWEIPDDFPRKDIMLMSKLLLLGILYSMQIGCLASNTDPLVQKSNGDLGCPVTPNNPDLLTPEAKCAAAKGLSGDVLACVDFDKVEGLQDSKLAGWFFWG
jgi:hypothetical protein